MFRPLPITYVCQVGCHVTSCWPDQCCSKPSANCQCIMTDAAGDLSAILKCIHTDVCRTLHVSACALQVYSQPGPQQPIGTLNCCCARTMTSLSIQLVTAHRKHGPACLANMPLLMMSAHKCPYCVDMPTCHVSPPSSAGSVHSTDPYPHTCTQSKKHRTLLQ